MFKPKSADLSFLLIFHQMTAKMWASEYNRSSPPKRIDFLVCWVCEFVDRPGRPLSGVPPPLSRFSPSSDASGRRFRRREVPKAQQQRRRLGRRGAQHAECVQPLHVGGVEPLDPRLRHSRYPPPVPNVSSSVRCRGHVHRPTDPHKQWRRVRSRKLGADWLQPPPPTSTLTGQESARFSCGTIATLFATTSASRVFKRGKTSPRSRG